jgi:DNA modification methylase
LVYQKHPKTTKNWLDNSIRDTWREKILEPRNKKRHPHRKPYGLVTRLLLATTQENILFLTLVLVRL